MNCIWIAATRLAAEWGVKVHPADLESSTAHVPHELEPEALIRAFSVHGIVGNVFRLQLLSQKDRNSLSSPIMLRITGGDWAVYLVGNRLATFKEKIWHEEILPFQEVLARSDGLAIQIISVDSRAHLSDEGYRSAIEGHWFFSKFVKSWRKHFDAAVATIFVNILGLAGAMFVMNVYDRIVPNSAFVSLWTLAIGVIFAAVIEFILKTSRSYILDSVGRKIDLVISSEIMSKVLSLKPERRPSSTVNFAGQVRDFDAVREFASSSTLIAMTDIPFAFLFLFVIYYIAGDLVIVPVTALTLTMVVGFLFGSLAKGSITRYMYESNQKHALMVEAIERLELIDSFGAKPRILALWEQCCAVASRSTLKVKSLGSHLVNVNALISQASTVFLVVFGVYHIDAGLMSIGGLIACSILMSRALAPALQVSALLGKWSQTKLAYTQIKKLMAEPERYSPRKSYLVAVEKTLGIELEAIRFSYGEKGCLAIMVDRLNMLAGEVVVVMGPVGSGKSTLLKIIAGLVDPQGGQIKMNGLDYFNLSPADLRRRIAWQSQETLLFNGSLYENLRIGLASIDESLLNKIISVCEIDKFDGFQRYGLEMPLGENGVKLSGGQRQLVSIARTLLADKDVVVLDEPTSMLDLRQEQRIMSSMKEHLVGRLLVVATHRQGPLAIASQLVVLDRGAVVISGPKRKVLDDIKSGKVSRAPQAASPNFTDQS